MPCVAAARCAGGYAPRKRAQPTETSNVYCTARTPPRMRIVPLSVCCTLPFVRPLAACPCAGRQLGVAATERDAPPLASHIAMLLLPFSAPPLAPCPLGTSPSCAPPCTRTFISCLPFFPAPPGVAAAGFPAGEATHPSPAARRGPCPNFPSLPLRPVRGSERATAPCLAIPAIPAVPAVMR